MESGNFWGNGCVHYLDWGDGFVGIYVKTCRTLQLKCVYCLSILPPNKPVRNKATPSPINQ